jgi:translation elongation factor EF-Ts
LNKQETVNELMRLTGKGKMACDISLSLTGGDIEKAIARMKVSYPGLRVNRPNEEQNHDTDC